MSLGQFNRLVRKTATKKKMRVLIGCVAALSTLFFMYYSSDSSGQESDKILHRHTRSMKPMIDMRGFPDTGGLCPHAGFFRNETDCTQFYRCVDFNRNGKHTVFRFMCGPMTVFDPSRSLCTGPRMAVPPCTPTLPTPIAPPPTPPTPTPPTPPTPTDPPPTPPTPTDPPPTPPTPTPPPPTPPPPTPPTPTVPPPTPPTPTPPTPPTPTDPPPTPPTPTPPPPTPPAPTPPTPPTPTDPPPTPPTPTPPPPTPPTPTPPPPTPPTPTPPPPTPPPPTPPTPTVPPPTPPTPTPPPPTPPPPTPPTPTPPPPTPPPPTPPTPTVPPPTPPTPTPPTPPTPTDPPPTPPTPTPPPPTPPTPTPPTPPTPTDPPPTPPTPTPPPPTPPPPTPPTPTVPPPTPPTPTPPPSTTTPSTTTSTTTPRTPKPETPPKPPFSFDCTSDKPLQFPLDCSRFYQCVSDGVQRIIYVFSCLPGLYFDDVSSQCRTPAEAVCKDTSSINDTTNSFDGPGGILRLDCNGNLYRYPLNCNNFYTCFKDDEGHEIINVFACAAGLVFDDSSLRCLLPQETSPCGDNNNLFKSPSFVFQLQEEIDTASILSKSRDIFEQQKTNLPKHRELSDLIIPKLPHQSGRGASQNKMKIRMNTYTPK
ncbi:protein transport protein SEC31-like [Daphnia pulex]|uniref:protein transport protein SEC31-like n=1 Tax=Daphnia pulex TaxID=6669 RepID=UPI001EDE04A9|nr:protein transport protein SEC31-like [Daphnia pulex]